MPSEPRLAPRPPRPLAVTCIAAAGLLLAAFYLVRLVLSLDLPPLPLSVPSWYLPLTGALWGGVGLALSLGLWRGSARAYRLTFWTVPAYLLWYWLDRLVFLRSDFAEASRPAALLVSAAALIVVYGTLTRPSVRSFFRENSDE